jgi:hypothetical protein
MQQKKTLHPSRRVESIQTRIFGKTWKFVYLAAWLQVNISLAAPFILSNPRDAQLKKLDDAAAPFGFFPLKGGSVQQLSLWK